MPSGGGTTAAETTTAIKKIILNIKRLAHIEVLSEKGLYPVICARGQDALPLLSGVVAQTPASVR